MKKRIWLTLVALLFSGTILAQGYQGKRFALNYQSSHGFIGELNWKKNFVLHRNSLNLTYVLGRTVSVQVGVNYAKKTMPADNSLFIIGTTNTVGYYGQKMKFNNATILDQTISFNLKFYPPINGSNAPIGSFVGVGFEFGTQNGVSYHSMSNNNPIFKYDEDNKQNLRILSFTSGRNMIFYERLIVGYGVQIGAGLTRHNQIFRHFMRTYFELGYIF